MLSARPFAGLAALVPMVLASAALSSAAWAQRADSGEGPGRPPTLDLSAVGEVQAAPDMARLSIGVSSQGPTALAAGRANAERMAQVMAALRKQGVADADIQTSSISLNPDYAYADNQPPKLTGYKAENVVTATVRDLAKLGLTIDAVSTAGANQVNGVTFGLKDPLASEDEARRRAAKALAAKADLYAQATGFRAVKLMTLREGFEPAPTPGPVMLAAARAGSAPTPVSAGELDIRVEVSGSYELVK
ncbi:MAG TPA: SIMPL domain-containing protein [Caulobacteraceae bacterium]|nr:SIMPL domain-containing protein [Caulobacteraceae bacterium]